MIDISRTLKKGTAIWPGDTPYELEEVLVLDEGDSVNLTSLTLSAHTGTHVDAPYHFAKKGPTIDQMDLQMYWGLAQVVTVSKAKGPLLPADLTGYDLNRARRLLIRSPASDWDPEQFPDGFIYPSPELADYLAGFGILLLGTDGPSMDHQHSKTLDGHHALWRRGIAILEWLDLSRAADGVYDFVALPLKIFGGDGSPVRAALRPLER